MNRGYQGLPAAAALERNPDGVGNWTMQRSSKEQGVCTELLFECRAAFRRKGSPPIQLGLRRASPKYYF